MTISLCKLSGRICVTSLVLFFLDSAKTSLWGHHLFTVIYFSPLWKGLIYVTSHILFLRCSSQTINSMACRLQNVALHRSVWRQQPIWKDHIQLNWNWLNDGRLLSTVLKLWFSFTLWHPSQVGVSLLTYYVWQRESCFISKYLLNNSETDVLVFP